MKIRAAEASWFRSNVNHVFDKCIKKDRTTILKRHVKEKEIKGTKSNLATESSLAIKWYYLGDAISAPTGKIPTT